MQSMCAPDRRAQRRVDLPTEPDRRRIPDDPGRHRTSSGPKNRICIVAPPVYPKGPLMAGMPGGRADGRTTTERTDLAGYDAGMRSAVALVGVIVFVVACDDGKPSAADSKVDEPAAADQPEAKAKPTSTPVEPAPEGTVWLQPGKRLVQTCDTNAGCPSALQPEGAKMCAESKLAGKTWRLPTLEEAKRFAGTQGLHDLTTFHWTSEPFAEDDQQVWIVDPQSGQSTTIPRDRKPFEVRCVADVEP